MVRGSSVTSGRLASSASVRSTQASAGAPAISQPLGQQAAAEARLLVGQHHPRAGAAGGERRGEPGRAAADHQHVAMGVALVVAVGIGRARRLAEARGAPDQRARRPGSRTRAGHLKVL